MARRIHLGEPHLPVVEVAGADRRAGEEREGALALLRRAERFGGRRDQRANHQVIVERPSGLAVAKSIIARMPNAWRTCERSLLVAGAAVRSDLAAQIPSGRRTGLAWLGIPGLLGVIFGFQAGATALVAGGAAAIVLGAFALVSDGRRRERIAQESERVSGRILSAREIDDDTVELELHIEREAGDVTIKTQQQWGAKLREQSLDGYVGCSFIGFWHPAYPSVVPRITIQRAADTPPPKTKT